MLRTQNSGMSAHAAALGGRAPLPFVQIPPVHSPVPNGVFTVGPQVGEGLAQGSESGISFVVSTPSTTNLARHINA